MSYRKKFRINDLNTGERFAKTADAVLSHYLGRVARRSRAYLSSNTAENLHDLRIALRRLRYILELYCPTLKPRRFNRVYDLAVALQNLLGERRDLDVMESKLSLRYELLKLSLPNEMSADFQREKAALDASIATALNEFIADKQVRKLAEK